MTQPFPNPRNHAEEIENARAYCCTHNCRQGRDCPARMRIERNSDRNSGAVVITITMLSAMFCLSVLAGMIWGLWGAL